MNRRFTDHQGFTLIELLVVIGIVGILAAIALPQYAVYKQKAVDTDMQAALHAGRQAMEAYYAEFLTYQNATETILHDSYGYRASPGMAFSIITQTDTGYKICVTIPGGTVAAMKYDTAVGLMQAGCP